MAKKKYRDIVVIKKRMVSVFLFLFIMFLLLQGRLFYIMVNKSDKYKSLATQQWTYEVKIDAKRGKILDRNGQELAVSANVYRVDIDMKTLKQTLTDKKLTTASVAPKIASALNMTEKDVTKKLDSKLPNGLPISSITLKRRIEKPEADKVRALDLRGIIISEDTKRYYPNNNLLSQVIGHLNSDGSGLTGVEKYYDKELSGIPGVKIAETDKNRSEMPDSISEYTKPVEGKDVRLTIDTMIQMFCDKAADEAIKDNKAKAVSIVVTDPRNGEILGMVNKPDYNLNDPWGTGKTADELNQEWRNRAVSDTFEPGSIFKVITAATAMSENLVSDSDRYVCNGSKKVGNRVIHCANTKGHGTQTFAQILQNSCNVGFMDVGEKIGKDKLYEYITKFGFGSKTGIDLPGEATGIVKKPQQTSDVDLATISFGQTNTISCVQYLAAFNAVANGGKWITPHVMKEIDSADTNGKEVSVKKYDNYNEKQVMDSAKAATLRGYLEKVVSEGGGKNAFIEGYHIAGKTGTAKKAGVGGYMDGKYISSFAGMAPADNPRITVLVSIDEPDPSNYYAGQISAPVAKKIFNDVFNYLALNTSTNKDDVARSMLKDVVIPNVRGMKKADAVQLLKSNNIDCSIEGAGDIVSDTNPVPGYTVKEGTKIVLYTGTTANYNGNVVVPSLVGFNAEKATKILESVGLKVTFSGSGLVSDQSLEPGQEVKKGTTIELKLDSVGD